MNRVQSKPELLTQAALDYQRIAKAIRFLTTHAREQPGLAAVARAAHLSEFHFQRLFSRWAGISPKRFIQFLTVEHAKQQLTASRALLDATFDAGLSSPGRLHDLFVSVEAVTPGEFKRRGNGLRIRYGAHPTPFGLCLLALTQRGVCWLSFFDAGDQSGAIQNMKAQWQGADFEKDPKATGRMVKRVFSRMRRREPVPLSLLLAGTNFQIKVWQALLKIPEGTVSTYGALGNMIGAPDASRAIGSAVGQNPIAYLIPCHRVIRKTGLIGGYRWGEERKRAILAREIAILGADISDNAKGVHAREQSLAKRVGTQSTKQRARRFFAGAPRTF